MELFNNGQLVAALDVYRQLFSINSEDAQAWHMAGAIAAMCGDYAAARTYSEQAIRLRPRAHAPYINLANILLATGDDQGALQNFSRALEISPGDPQAMTGIANLHARHGNFAQAESLLRDVIRSVPGYVSAYNELGNVYRELARLDDAANCFRQAISIDPRYIDAICNLGAILIEQLRFTEAEQCYRMALQIQPDNPLILHGYGNLHQSLGKFDRARDCYAQALALDPSRNDTRTSLASLHERCGERDAAFELIDPLIRSGNYTPDTAVIYARLCRKEPESGLAIRALESSLESTSSPGKVIDICFSLGELYDQAGRYDEAFACFRRANDMDTRPMASVNYSDSVKAITGLYNSGTWPSFPRSNNRSELPVFIVGMPRTGTSLVEQILASHPQVCAGGERNDIFTITDSLMSSASADTSFADALAALTTEQLDALSAEYLSGIGLLAGDRTRFTDKTPLHGILLGFINQLLPRSRVIICNRDGLDTCLSIYFHRFNAYHGYATQLEKLGSFYREYYRLIAHWVGLLDLEMLEVQYEKLVVDPEQSIHRIIEFCGLDWDDRCLSFHRNSRIVNTPSYNQVRRPMYTDSIGRWKKYANHLEPLMKALKGA